jgi:hypothetical protein
LPPGYTKSWLRFPRTNPLSAVTMMMVTSCDPLLLSWLLATLCRGRMLAKASQ